MSWHQGGPIPVTSTSGLAMAIETEIDSPADAGLDTVPAGNTGSPPSLSFQEAARTLTGGSAGRPPLGPAAAAGPPQPAMPTAPLHIVTDSPDDPALGRTVGSVMMSREPSRLGLTAGGSAALSYSRSDLGGSIMGGFKRFASNILAGILGGDSGQGDADAEEEDEEDDDGDDLLQEGMEERTYNLRRVPYLKPADHSEDTYWALRSGQPFPSYHENPTRDLPSRWTCIPGVRDPVEDIRAPRLRLGPGELAKKERFLEAVATRSLLKKDAEVDTVHTLNLSYQNLGDSYQYDTLLSFLDLNRGVERLSLTDNMLVTAQDMFLPKLRKLWLSRNQILTFNVIPCFPLLEELHVTYNFISNLDGLEDEKWPELRKLSLRGNPVCDTRNFAKKIRSAIPKLTHLDGECIQVKVKGAFGMLAEALKDEDERAFQEQRKAAQDVKTKTAKLDLGGRRKK